MWSTAWNWVGMTKNSREIPNAIEGYNGEDCLSTAALRDWLEVERQR